MGGGNLLNKGRKEGVISVGIFVGDNDIEHIRWLVCIYRIRIYGILIEG